MKYEKTKDPNIIKQIETTESNIYLDRLEQEIKTLQEQIDNVPEVKEKPDQETLDFWNDNRPPLMEDELKSELTDKEKLLNKLKAVK